MVPAAQYRALADALASVGTNGQALAVADLCLGTLATVQEHFSPWARSLASWLTFGLYGAGSPDRANAAAALADAVVDVQRYREPMVGNSSAPIVGPDWDNLRLAIERAYNVAWNVTDVEGDETEWKNFVGWVGSTLADSVQNMPFVIQSAVSYVGDLATKTTGGVVAGVLAGFWPVLLIAGGVTVVAVLVLGKGGVAALAKGGR